MARRKLKSAEDVSTVSDTVLRELVGYNLKRAYVAMRDDLAMTLSEFELRATTFSALTMIVEHPNLTQTQLAAVLGVERSGVVALVDELEAPGLVGRHVVPDNRRSYALRATPAGARLCARAWTRVRAHEARLLAHMTMRHRSDLIELLQTVERAGTVTKANRVGDGR